jgi:hypothetical protein
MTDPAALEAVLLWEPPEAHVNARAVLARVTDGDAA